MKSFKSFLIVQVLFISIFYITGCTHDDPIKNELNIDLTTKSEVYVNFDPSDYTIANIYSSEGDTIYVFGHKDDSGMPLSMDNVIIKPHDSEGSTEIFFNEEKQPIKVTTPNGVVMLFEWMDNDRAALTMIDQKTEEQLNTIIDFTRTEEDYDSSQVNANFNTRKQTSTMKVLPLSQKEKPIAKSSYLGSNKTGSLIQTQCGISNNAECWVDAYSYDGMPLTGLGTFIGRLKCEREGNGYYRYTLPYGTKGIHHNLSEHCETIMNILTGICDVNNKLGPAYKQAICTQISFTLAAGIVSAPVALAFGEACSLLNISLEVFCHTPAMAAAGWGDPSYSAGNAFCDIIKEMHIEWDDELMFLPVVNALPNTITGTPEKWDGVSNYLPTLYVQWGGEPKITQFVLSPAAPVHHQSYKAIAYLYCLTAGTIITMSIIGTDGYSDTKIYSVGDEIDYEATLDVPGAEKGVKDVCTIKLESPDGSVKTKKASLVFH